MNRQNNKKDNKRFNKDKQPARSPRISTSRDTSKASKKNYVKDIKPERSSGKRVIKESSTKSGRYENKNPQITRSPLGTSRSEISKVSDKNFEKDIRPSRTSDKRSSKEPSSAFKKYRERGSQSARTPHKRISNKPSKESENNFEKDIRPAGDLKKKVNLSIRDSKKFGRKDSRSVRPPNKGISNKPSTEIKDDEKGGQASWSPRKRPVKKSSIVLKKVDENETRLNKYLASTGLCSRREADQLIQSGLVTVNGELVTELGVKVKKGDDIRYNGERLKTERLVYLLLNKPKDYVTTMHDDHAKKTVMDLIHNACKERIYPVGRLDKNTTGVLLFTNDGDLAKKLAHPSSNKLKIYHVTLDKSLNRSDFNKILEGITLDDGFIKADALNFVLPKSMKEVGIEIHSGRNHIVKRIFEHFEYKVRKLDRVYFAGLTKKGLERGKYRFLTETEIAMLKMGSYK